MTDSERLIHADCGGNVRRDPEKQHYVCDRCHAEAEGMISSANPVEGKLDEVILCNPHADNF
jgi:hypothetical protein